ncbi:MAG: fumarate hydratase [Dissulfuribacterales bacterium]
MTNFEQEIIEKVADLVRNANTILPAHVFKAICAAAEQESKPLARFILNILTKNAELAAQTGLPICQDTGIDVFFVKMGRNLPMESDIHELINRGVAKGTKEGLLRASVCDPLTRQNTRDNTPAIVHATPVSKDNYLSITVLPKGCGSENMSAVFMLPPSAGTAGIIDAVCQQVQKAGPNPCPPGIIGIGVGGDLERAAILAKKALLRPIGAFHGREDVASLEREILKRINALGIGPHGFGGDTTTLHVAMEVFHCHIASLPVAINIQCHAARSQKAVWQNGGWQLDETNLQNLHCHETVGARHTSPLHTKISQMVPNNQLHFRPIHLPFTHQILQELRAGDLLLLNGILYTGRDQTHKRLVELLNRGEGLPIDLKGQLIYYVGPSPAPEGLAIGAAGPTTSYRMDRYTPRLLELGLAATMGKGKRSPEVKDAMKAHGAVYLATIGGAGAYLSRCIRSCEVIAFPELGTEAMYRMEVQDLPAVVINDTMGEDFYEKGMIL